MKCMAGGGDGQADYQSGRHNTGSDSIQREKEREEQGKTKRKSGTDKKRQRERQKIESEDRIGRVKYRVTHGHVFRLPSAWKRRGVLEASSKGVQSCGCCCCCC